MRAVITRFLILLIAIGLSGSGTTPAGATYSNVNEVYIPE